MKFALLLATGVLLTAIPANAMDAETFFIKAVALKKKGMGAVFAKDLKPMMRVFEAAAKASRLRMMSPEQSAPLYYASPKKYRLTADQFISEFSRIRKERRQIQSVRDAWREIVIRRFPC